MNNPIDIFILCYKRPEYTKKTLEYLFERTTYPFRLFLIIQDDDPETRLLALEYGDKVFMTISFSRNVGISPAWNTALALAESEYFITSDNDIYVPDLRNKIQGVVPNLDNVPKMDFVDIKQGGAIKNIDRPVDWLERMVYLMDERPDYGAISLHPHVFVGAAGIDPNDPEDVKERNMCGGVMRIMRRDAVWKAGGWEREIKAGRGTEERTICSRLQAIGYKVGITTRIRAYHPFGKNWGYDEDITPEMQGHNPELADYVTQFDRPQAYDPKTWMPL